uniref:type II secretion system protein GspD n=1 Tax=Gelidibacter sp. TaxID=2018083 RepID=UPI0040499699
MKNVFLILILLLSLFSYSQKEDPRIANIRHQLEVLATENAGLSENYKTEIQISTITLSNFLIALSDVHKVNINVSPELNQISLTNNFTNVTVSDLLVFLCKEYDLTIDFTGNILSIKKYQEPIVVTEERVIPVEFNPNNNTISIDAKSDNLYEVFKRVMDVTGRNLVFTPGLENKPLIAYIQNMPFDAAMEKLGLANNLYVEKTKDGFYVFEDNTPVGANANNTSNNASNQRPARRRNANFFFKVLDSKTKTLEVDFLNTPIGDIINDIGDELKIDVFTATPLDNIGTASLRAKSITFDELLVKLFETQNNSGVSSNSINNSQRNVNDSNISGSSGGDKFTFKKENSIYFFGTEKQLSVRKVEVIALQFRSIELLSDPQGGSMSNRNFGNMSNNNFGGQFDNFSNPNNPAGNNRNQPNNNNFNNPSNFNGANNATASSLLDLIPSEIQGALDIKVDKELNSFYVIGASTEIERFKAFVTNIDKPVPVVLIEVMIIEVSRNNKLEAGVSWGIGDEPVQTRGGIFPETNLTLGANTINKIIGGFDDFGGFNLGKVVPNFFATIKAMESNGDLKIRSTPKLATLNGHRATFSNGQTSYYAITQRNIYGTDNPQTSEFTNYYPIDVELGLTIKPSVTSDGHVLLDIYVIQSSFGQRIADDAPPDINSRNFTSIIRMQDQDIAILGGLEEQYKNNSGSGVPFLARVPLIKWLFSSRVREGRKSKLTVLIKPTIIN